MARVSRKPVRQRVLPVADTGQHTTYDSTTKNVGTISVSTRRVSPINDNEEIEAKEDKDQEQGSSNEDRTGNQVVDPVIDCRDKSSSAWLHFPHVELLFLFFAFEGFVAAQIYGIEQSRCRSVQIVAAVVLVSLLNVSIYVYILYILEDGDIALKAPTVAFQGKSKYVMNATLREHTHFHSTLNTKCAGAIPGAHVYGCLPHHAGPSLLQGHHGVQMGFKQREN